MALGDVRRDRISEIRKARASRRARLHRVAGRAILFLLMLTLSFIFLIPFFWLISTSLKLPGKVFIQPIEWIPKPPQWSNYLEVFRRLPFHRFIINTLFVTTMGTLGSVISSLLVGFGLAKIRWPGRNLLFSVVIGTMMLPGVVTMIPLFIMFKKVGWVGSFYPLWVPSWFGSAFHIFLVRQYMLTLPNELNEAARIDGAGNFAILWRIIVPLCGPAIASVAIFSFMSHYNNFMGPLIYISKNEMFTIPLGLLWFQGRFGNFWHLVMAAAFISVIPVIALFFFAQSYFIQGVQFSGLAGR